MQRRTLLGTIAALPALTAGGRPARADQSSDTLRITWRDAIPDIDPYRNNLRTGLTVTHEAWDTLVYRDPDSFENVPLLATDWKWVDPKTLDFTLRQGVKFHNGDPFTADDVVYTFTTIKGDPKVMIPSQFAFIKSVQKIDDFHVRFTFNSVFPAALQYFAMVLPIYPQAYREKVGHDAFSQHPVGSGPYKITLVNGSSEIDLERFDGYWAGSPKGRPAIRYLKITEVEEDTDALTAFISGQTDWIWKFNPDQFQNLASLPGKKAVQGPTMRIVFLSMDTAGRTGKDNPLTNVKVRQAIAHAIDRASIATNLVQGGSQPIATPCYPGQFGCDVSAAVDYPYDPAKAKALLAEAGYPNGFSTSFTSYLLPAWNAAIQNYLQAVGIKADVEQLQVGAAIAKSNAGQTPLFAGSWGSNSINDVSAILPYYFGGGPADYVRDPTLAQIIKAGDTGDNAQVREQDYAQAIQRITAAADWLPLFTYVDNYAFDSHLDFTPYKDELPRFYLCKWI
jgi:peptide/nickel transport system substrate-binding protein